MPEKLFPVTDPLDKEVSLAGIPFRVVGVAEKVGSILGQSADNFALVPLSTYRAIWMGRPELFVFVKAPDSQHMTELKDEVRALMRVRRHVPYHEDDPFGINASETIMSAWQSLTGTIFAVTIGLVAVFMVVGGIVIMNIMLASVTERTHEIGIRKSVGARRRDILWQFLIESGVMSSIGGITGVIFAVGIARLVDMVFAASVPPVRGNRGTGAVHGGGPVFWHLPRQQGGRPRPHRGPPNGELTAHGWLPSQRAREPAAGARHHHQS